MTNQSGLFHTSITHEPLSEVGKISIDKIIFIWSLQTLNSEISINAGGKCFDKIISSYNKPERLFHRGLGHPRQLIPSFAQRVYYVLLSTKIYKDKYDNKDLSAEDFFELKTIFDKFIPLAEKNSEAQGILSAFYHDVVHRRDKISNIDDVYKLSDYSLLFSQQVIPITVALLASNSPKIEQEFSCIIAEIELSNLGISKEHLVPIILAIYSTKPLTQKIDPDCLRTCLSKIEKKLSLKFSEENVKKILDMAIGLSNRDMACYGSDSFDDFNKKIMAKLYEENPDFSHSLVEELQCFDKFFDFHKNLFDAITVRNKSIFINLDPDDQRTITLNNHAKKLIELDLCLHSLLLGTLKIKSYMLTIGNSMHSLVENYMALLVDERLEDIPNEVVDVLQQHGQETQVNGISFTRGTETAKWTLLLIKLFGAEQLSKLASSEAEPIEERIENLLKTNDPSLQPY